MQKDILILGLGNELLADDGVGVLAVREIRKSFSDRADVIDTAEAGMALLDIFIGYKKTIIIDAIFTSDGKPGDVHQLSPDDLDSVIAPSPHFAGLPEIWAVAAQLELEFPDDIKIYALEVGDPFTIGGEISEEVLGVIPKVVEMTSSQLDAWEKEQQNA